jgi:hypothetical protein
VLLHDFLPLVFGESLLPIQAPFNVLRYFLSPPPEGEEKKEVRMCPW